MRNLASKISEPDWPEFRAHAKACYEGGTLAKGCTHPARRLGPTLREDVTHGQCSASWTTSESCIAHLRFPVKHRRGIRTTNLLEKPVHRRTGELRGSLYWENRNSQPNSIREKKRGGEYRRGGVCPTTTFSRRHPTPPRATQRRLTTPNATFGSQMARFPRPYCATEPVRTVPFFNLYDDIQITQLGAFTDEFGTTTIAARSPCTYKISEPVHRAHCIVSLSSARSSIEQSDHRLRLNRSKVAGSTPSASDGRGPRDPRSAT